MKSGCADDADDVMIQLCLLNFTTKKWQQNVTK